jgi:hypothetical protein
VALRSDYRVPAWVLQDKLALTGQVCLGNQQCFYRSAHMYVKHCKSICGKRNRSGARRRNAADARRCTRRARGRERIAGTGACFRRQLVRGLCINKPCFVSSYTQLLSDAMSVIRSVKVGVIRCRVKPANHVLAATIWSSGRCVSKGGKWPIRRFTERF